VENPDSKKPANIIDDFISISDYRELTKDILANPINLSSVIP